MLIRNGSALYNTSIGVALIFAGTGLTGLGIVELFPLTWGEARASQALSVADLPVAYFKTESTEREGGEV